MAALLNGFAFALLLTSLFVLRFRGWQRPGLVVAYFTFFAALEIALARYVLPPDAFGPGMAKLCLALTVPVSVAAVLVWRHELRHSETD